MIETLQQPIGWMLLIVIVLLGVAIARRVLKDKKNVEDTSRLATKDENHPKAREEKDDHDSKKKQTTRTVVHEEHGGHHGTSVWVKLGVAIFIIGIVCEFAFIYITILSKNGAVTLSHGATWRVTSPAPPRATVIVDKMAYCSKRPDRADALITLPASPDGTGSVRNPVGFALCTDEHPSDCFKISCKDHICSYRSTADVTAWFDPIRTRS